MLLSVAVTATRVPGLKWDALEVWEASALPGAWDDVDGYLDFRTYALDRLSDLGFLDILLDDLRTSAAPVLRVIADCGDYTGMTVLLVGAAAAAASFRLDARRGRSRKRIRMGRATIRTKMERTVVDSRSPSSSRKRRRCFAGFFAAGSFVLFSLR